MNIESEKKRLLQTENLKLLFEDKLISEMVTVYYSNSSSAHHNHGIYCALIPNSEIKNILTSDSWDLAQDGGYPRVTIDYENNIEIPTYHRYGFNQGIEPLIFDRTFHGLYPDYKELNEEFRLFHGLYHDVKENKYIKIMDSGVKEVVAIVEADNIRIRLKEIRQFLAIKEMHLAIQFDFKEFSLLPLGQLNLSASDNKKINNDLACWSLVFEDISCCDFKGCSRLLGKRLIPPLPKSKSGMWGFAEEKSQQYVDFIIGIDDDGDNKMYSSNYKLLANSFGANPDAPNYLTAVHFRKEVLNKYYHQSSKFSVQDNYLSCGSLWSLQIDNHHADKICVWLGDLGRDLPYEEQLYWRSYNIVPVGTVSDEYYRQQICAEFTDSKQVEHIFINCYESLCDACSNHLGWQLLLPLSKEDLHHLSSIRIPATEEQSDFDAQILALTKILIDSLNEKKLNTLIPSEDRINIKSGISRLEKVFQTLSVADYEKHIKFLRNLQDLRSSSVAHRKGSTYEKIAKNFGITSNSLLTVLEQIFENSNEFLEFLTNAVNNDLFKPSENL